MSDTTREINKVTRAIISVSWKLIVCGVAVLLLYEAVTRGYRFGHSLFYDTAAAEPPGVEMRVTIGEDRDLFNLATALEESGLIKDRYAFLVQSFFYGYGNKKNPVREGTFRLNSSMTAKELIITLRDEETEEEIRAAEEASAGAEGGAGEGASAGSENGAGAGAGTSAGSESGAAG